jgi:hypothetical protein
MTIYQLDFTSSETRIGSRLRIRIGNTDPGPDPDANKLAKSLHFVTSDSDNQTFQKKV